MWQIISNYIGILILGIGEIIFARIILGKKIEVNKYKVLLILLFTTILSTICSTYLNGITNTILLYIVHLFEFKILFDLTYYKATFLTFLYLVVIMIPDILAMLIITNVFGMSKEVFYNKFAGNIIGNLTICVLFVITTLVLKKVLKKLVSTEISDNIKIITLSVITLFTVLLFFYTFVKKFEFTNNVFEYLFAIIVLIGTLYNLMKQTIENNKLTKEYDSLLEFMTTYENEIEKQRILRHEIKNEFRTIRAKICDQQENKEIIEYIDEIVNDKYEVKQEKYAKFGYLPANGTKGLCYFKTEEAENKGIQISLNISKKVKNSSIYNLNIKQQRDFGRILGVFLDNAIEASINSKEKKLGIEAYSNSKQEFKMIISNTYSNKIDNSKIGIESFSTKGKNRGHGLLLVKQLVGKNDIFEIKTDIQDNLYIQTIEIKKIIDQRNL